MNINLVSNLELFTILTDQVSAKISGGNCAVSDQDANLVEALRIDRVTEDPCLQTKIVEQVKNIFPEGVGNATSLSCATAGTIMQCEVSSNGKKGNFTIDSSI